MKVIMLSAMYENGGNTTHRLLDGHPELFVYPFESQVGTGAANDFLTSYVPIRYRWPEFGADVDAGTAYEMFWDEELKTLLRVPGRSKFRECGLKMDEKKRKAAFAEFARGKPANRATFVEAFFKSTFDTWENVNRTGKEKAYVGYNPVQVFDTDKILADFPDGHVIHVARNPYSGFADTVKRPFPLSLKRYAWTWNLCQHFALTYQEKYPDRFHLVRFEDIVADTPKVMDALAKRLGLAPSEKTHYPSFNGVKLEEVYPWGTIRTPTPEANMATANELDAKQKAEMKAETLVMQRLLGYDGLF
jgi:hypothetical protein